MQVIKRRLSRWKWLYWPQLNRPRISTAVQKMWRDFETWTLERTFLHCFERFSGHLAWSWKKNKGFRNPSADELIPSLRIWTLMIGHPELWLIAFIESILTEFSCDKWAESPRTNYSALLSRDFSVAAEGLLYLVYCIEQMLLSHELHQRDYRIQL
jgi:hypothetical protein